MKTADLKSLKAEVDNALPAGSEAFGNTIDNRSADEFSRVMDGFKAVESTSPGPSLTSQWIRAPGAVYERTMGGLNRPAPLAMPPVQAMQFFNDRQTDLFKMKTLNSVVNGFAKLIKKNVELVLNNK
jgi:hypothetical protein